jgi:hypothetical protein
VTLADRLAVVILERGPMPVCDLAPAVRKQKTEVISALNGNLDRFVHNGLKARASRWDVRREVSNGVGNFSKPVVTFPPDFDLLVDDLVKLVHPGRERPEVVLLAALRVLKGAAA